MYLVGSDITCTLEVAKKARQKIHGAALLHRCKVRIRWLHVGSQSNLTFNKNTTTVPIYSILLGFSSVDMSNFSTLDYVYVAFYKVVKGPRDAPSRTSRL